MFGNRNKVLNQSAVVSSITKSAKELIKTVANENAKLEIGKISNINIAVADKVAALRKFNESQIEVEKYADDGGQFDKTSAPLIKLKDLFDELNKVNKRNEVLIRSNLEVSDKIISMYKEGKTQETLRRSGYNNEGKVAAFDKIEKIMPSIGLNNKV